MSYNPINWQNDKIGGTKVNATNLNIMDKGIADAHDMLEEHESIINEFVNQQLPEEYVKEAVDTYVENNSAGFATAADLEEVESQLDSVNSEVGELSSEIVEIDEELKINIFSYDRYIELIENGNGYYDTNGNWVDSYVYKNYRLVVDKGESVLIQARASASVACIALFDSNFLTMQSVIQKGHINDGGLHDYVYSAQEVSHIVISSATTPYAQHIGKTNEIVINEWTEGRYINPLGVTVEDANYEYSRMFPLKKGDTLHIKNLLVNKNTCCVGVFDNQTLLKDVTSSIKTDSLLVTDFDYVAEKAVEYIRVCTQISANTEIFIIQNVNNNTPNTYGVALEGKSFNIIGDSYVAGEGMGVNNTWAGLISSKYGMTYRNYGQGGKTSQWVIENIPSMENDADYIGCICGKNDYNGQIPIDTFKANIATICDLLINKYLGKKIFLGTPWRVTEETEVAVGGAGKPIALQEYVDAMIEVCGEKSVPCFDASRNSGVFIDNANFRAMYMLHENDVSHLNVEGFKYVMPKYEAFMLTL